MSVVLLNVAPDQVDAAAVNQLRELLPDRRVVVTQDKAEIDALLDDVEIASGHVAPDLVMRMPNLRWLQQWGAGVDWLMKYPEAVDKDFVMTNASGVHPIPISEHIFGMILLFGRRLQHAVLDQPQRKWYKASNDDVFELAGKTMLLIGVGAIGERTARIANAFGMQVEGIRNNPSRGAEHVGAMYGTDQLLERLPHADIIVLTVPLSKSTKNMIGAEQLRAMKSSAYLINIGRGGTIDEQALKQALDEGWIAGAALDVFEQEPLPDDSPLWDAKNLIITDHYAGATPKYNERAMAIFLDNVRHYLDGTPMRNEVDKSEGY